MLGDVASMVPGVVHIEVDAESHLELVRQLDVTRTPTVLVLDSTGRIRTRATGAPLGVGVISGSGAGATANVAGAGAGGAAPRMTPSR